MHKILLVDDEPIAIEAIISRIEKEALNISNIDYTYDVDDAQEMLEAASYDVVICDIEMPDKSGIDLVKWINAMGIRTVCVFLTCHPEFNYAKEAISLGVFDYLVKPIDKEELNLAIKKALAERKKQISSDRARTITGDISEKIEMANQTVDQSEEAVKAARKYILENIGDEELDVKAVAAHVYLNPDYLSRLFKSYLNTSVKNYIVSSRIALASELLVNTTLSVSKIAMSCGYVHMAHFSKMFKQETGLTPNEYRAKYKK